MKISGIDYDFKDEALIRQALTHSSYCAGSHAKWEKDNERLEFLGDAFLDAVIGEELYRRLPHQEEGTLTRIRAQIVCEGALAEVARQKRLGEKLTMGHGEEVTGGRDRDSILADAMEAVLGAVFLDGGYEALKKFVLAAFSNILNEAVAGRRYSDFKTAIQEKLQGLGKTDIRYNLDGEEGPDHCKLFRVSLWCEDTVLGRGTGRSKKEAEQMAAREAIKKHVF